MTEALTSLTEAQIEQLADLLEEHAVENQGMNLEALDGYLNAIVLSPSPIPYEEWEPKIWGEARLSDANQSLAQSLLKTHYESVQLRVQYDADDIPDELTPLMWLPEETDIQQSEAEDLDVGADWARGFFEAVDLREEQWNRWLDEEEFIEEIFNYIDQLESGEVMDVEDPTSTNEGSKIEFKERLEIISVIPTMMHDIAVKQRKDDDNAKVLQ